MAFVHLTPHPHDVSARGQMHYGESMSKQRGCEGRSGEGARLVLTGSDEGWGEN
jgi:hypothetical protein